MATTTASQTQSYYDQWVQQRLKQGGSELLQKDLLSAQQKIAGYTTAASQSTDGYKNLQATITSITNYQNSLQAPTPATPSSDFSGAQALAGATVDGSGITMSFGGSNQIDPAQAILDSPYVDQGNAFTLNQVTGTGGGAYLVDSQTAAAGTSAGGAPSGGADLLTQLSNAYNDALRAGSQATNQLIQQNIAASMAGVYAQNRATAALTDLMTQSTQAQQQSADLLGKTIESLKSGSKGAQTQFSAVDVSAEMAKAASDRANLKRKGGVGTQETKTAVLAPAALLSKPTLLGQ